MMIWIATLIVLLYIISFYANERYRTVSKMFPGPLALPFIGNGYVFLRPFEDYYKTMLQYAEQYNYKTIRLFLIHVPYLLVFDYKTAKMILSSNTQIDKASEYRLFEPWIGKGLLTETGKRYKEHRKLITPAFHYKMLQNFIKIFDLNANIITEKLEAHSGKKAFDVFNYMSLHALDNICDSAMGVSVNALENPNSEYVKAVKTMVETTFKRVVTPWLRPDGIFKYTSEGKMQKKALEILHGYINGIIQKRKEGWDENLNVRESENNEKRKMAFMDLLLETSREGRLTEDEVRDEVATIMFGGHDTGTTALSFVLYLLGEHQDVQEKVYEELQSIFGTSDKSYTYDDLNEMKYLEQVIKETLRLHPVVPFIARKFEEDFYINEHQYIPKNTPVAILISAIHKDPKIWPNPDVFDPDRFTLEECQNRDPFAFLPFSAGVRSCIGQKFAMYEMKVTLSKILRKFKIFLSDNPKDKIRPKFGIVMTSCNGVIIRIQPRN